MKSLVLFSIFFVFLIISNEMFAQFPGDFYVDNQTDCDYDIYLWHGTSGCGSSSCAGTMVMASNQAAQNTTTLVDDGQGYAGSNAWIEIEVRNPAIMGGYPKDGYCATNNPAPECGGSDIVVTFDDCNNATITYP